MGRSRLGQQQGDTMENVWLKARRAFLPFDGVVGVAFGPKLTKGKVVARRAIVVLVEQKRPAARIAKGQHIPPSFEGLPTDVRVPRLTPPARKEAGAALGDYCLTDYRWIDWKGVHRRWLDGRRRPRPEPKKGNTP